MRTGSETKVRKLFLTINRENRKKRRKVKERKLSCKKMQILEANTFVSTGISDKALGPPVGELVLRCHVKGASNGWSEAPSNSKQEHTTIFCCEEHP